MADTALSVLKGVIAALSADAGISALVVSRVYTDVPQNCAFPYVVVSVQSEPFAASDFSGQTHTLRVQGFSREAGSKQALSIRKAAMNVLDRKESSLSLDEGILVMCQYSGLSDCFIEDDGKTWQSVIEFEMTVV